MSVFVTGTDTEVGKTLVSTLILLRYASRHRLTYWKPVATGADDGRDTVTVRRWIDESATVAPECYLFRPPVSPHLASRRARRRIDPRVIARRYADLRRSDPRRHLVVEGIGGLLVPLTARGYLVADLIRRLALPCLVVARSTLGTINHTLLTLAAARARGVRVIGVVLSGPRNPSNREAIEGLGRVKVIAQVQPLGRRIRRQTLVRAARGFDRPAVLRRYLT